MSETVEKTEKQKSVAAVFLEIAKPNERGFSKEILLCDLLEVDSRFATGNGGHWCRSDGPLRKYNIIRNKKDGKIFSVRLDGFNKNPKERAISPAIQKEIVKKKCVVLAVSSNIQCDHKDGMYDDKTVADVKTQKPEDFQPLSGSVNVAKRTHCNRCKETGKRFDATILGFSHGFLEGDANTKSCHGCYWHDPPHFNKTISAGYEKEY